ncbi:hypothetical protein [Sphingobacterium yanglingense]|uniref:Uncharacterized protein n=1 Tax=Sphingobacterium yanglingense TaxID=1437280 RepID=A0A4R6WLE0_9SPHI|nr:hypothetical protein [Sphingobacterium yanglingense]TDQ79552.1 hypothetical protein CLV99_0995 [Sphingobacterium yanglingense]
MEQYEYFCAISKHLYSELENVALVSYAYSLNGIDNSELEQRKAELLHKIEEHLNGLEMAIFEKENKL